MMEHKLNLVQEHGQAKMLVRVNIRRCPPAPRQWRSRSWGTSPAFSIEPEDGPATISTASDATCSSSSQRWNRPLHGPRHDPPRATDHGMLCLRAILLSRRWEICSPRCREAFDAGWPIYQPPVITSSLPKGGHGFLIDCAGCHKQFDSKGLRCCSPDCERGYQRKQRLESDLVGAAFRVARRICAAPACTVEIPNWRNGRRVRSKFCSPRCQKRNARSAIREPDGLEPLLSAKQAKKCPKIGPSREVVESRSIAVAEAAGREAPGAEPKRAIFREAA